MWRLRRRDLVVSVEETSFPWSCLCFKLFFLKGYSLSQQHTINGGVIDCPHQWALIKNSSLLNIIKIKTLLNITLYTN